MSIVVVPNGIRRRSIQFLSKGRIRRWDCSIWQRKTKCTTTTPAGAVLHVLMGRVWWCIVSMYCLEWFLGIRNEKWVRLWINRWTAREIGLVDFGLKWNKRVWWNQIEAKIVGWRIWNRSKWIVNNDPIEFN